MSLINDALKRAAEAQGQPQAQAPTRPRGPKGVEDLPIPMTPVSARERRAWVPVVGIGLVIVALLGASGFFFAKWWKERKAWQPYATEDIDEDGMPKTNLVAKAEPPKAVPPKTTKALVAPAPTATNPPAMTKVAVVPPTPLPEPSKTNTSPVAVTPTPVSPPTPVPPVAPTPTNLVTQPSPPPQPPTPAPPPKAEPVKVVSTNTTPPPTPPPTTPPETAKKGDDHVTKVASVEFPELKLQGISRRKNKTFAVLNGKTLSVGDRIEGVMLLKIDTDSVIVEKGGARRELFLLR